MMYNGVLTLSTLASLIISPEQVFFNTLVTNRPIQRMTGIFLLWPISVKCNCTSPSKSDSLTPFSIHSSETTLLTLSLWKTAFLILMGSQGWGWTHAYNGAHGLVIHMMSLPFLRSSKMSRKWIRLLVPFEYSGLSMVTSCFQIELTYNDRKIRVVLWGCIPSHTPCTHYH